MTSKRKSFLVHIDSLDILDDLTDEQAGMLFKAIKAHQKGEDLELSPIVKIAFSPFKNQFARDDEKYQKIVERNKNNGLKGGRPKTQDNPKKPTGLNGNPDNPSKADSVNDSDSKSDSDSKNKEISLSDNSDAISVLTYLNEICSSKYKYSTKSHIENINARLAEGHSVEDCKAVIDSKFAEWGSDSRMAGYLRPSTLFSTGKFQGYLMASKAKGSTTGSGVNAIGTDFSAPEGWT